MPHSESLRLLRDDESVPLHPFASFSRPRKPLLDSCTWKRLRALKHPRGGDVGTAKQTKDHHLRLRKALIIRTFYSQSPVHGVILSIGHPQICCCCLCWRRQGGAGQGRGRSTARKESRAWDAGRQPPHALRSAPSSRNPQAEGQRPWSSFPETQTPASP